MDVRDAYDLILREIAEMPEVFLGEHYFDATAFGNFVIDYRSNGKAPRFINDRGQIFHSRQGDDGRFEMIVDGISRMDADDFVAPVRLKLNDKTEAA